MPHRFTVATHSAILIEDLRPVGLGRAEPARNKPIEECQRNALGKVLGPVRARVCGGDARVSAVGVTPDLGAAEGIASLAQSVVVQGMSRFVIGTLMICALFLVVFTEVPKELETGGFRSNLGLILRLRMQGSVESVIPEAMPTP